MKITKAKIQQGIYLYYQYEPDPAITKGVLSHFVKTGEPDAGLSLKMIKNDFSGREVYTFSFQDKVYYLKRYFHRRISKVIKNWIREPEGLRYFNSTVAIAGLGIPVTKPVFAITMRMNPLITDSLYVSEEFCGSSLDQLAMKCSLRKTEREMLLRKIAVMWSTLYLNRYVHGDPNLGNILVNTDTLDMALVDIDGIRKWPVLPEKKLLDNLAKLNYFSYLSFDNAPGRKLDEDDRAVFFDAFFSHYPKKMHTREPIYYLYQSTIKRLIRFNREDIVNNSPFLSFMQHDSHKEGLFS